MSATNLPTREVFEVGEGAITLAVTMHGGRLVIVLRAYDQPEVHVHVPMTVTDGESFARVLVSSLRWLQPQPHCIACRQPWPGTEHGDATVGRSR
jgi:hypothetical protein